MKEKKIREKKKINKDNVLFCVISYQTNSGLFLVKIMH